MKGFILFFAAMLSCLSAIAGDAPERDFMEVNVTEPGKLAELLGERANEIDSLVVSGTIDATDFDAMWSATFYGNLLAINLENAKITDGKVPDNAFYHHDAQHVAGSIKLIGLQRIILGEGVTEIGASAFLYAANLREIMLPKSLRKLGDNSFSDCYRLMTSPLVIPEGVTAIPRRCFIGCRALSEVVLPSTIRSIGDMAFFSSKITKINFPEGLEKIENCAFYATRLKEVTLPESCLTLEGEGHFSLNYELERLTLPSGLTAIPNGLADNCMSLTEVNIPSGVTEIGKEAFYLCPLSGSMELPEGLTQIGGRAFSGSSGLTEVTFPSTLADLGQLSCEGWSGVRVIRCCSAVPPHCAISPKGFGSFGEPDYSVNGGILTNIPVYIPKGSIELYRNAPGWDCFFNFIETDNPSAGITAVTGNEAPAIAVEGDEIVISGCDGHYAIYTLDGATIAAGTAGAGEVRVTVASGCYIVNAAGAVKKIRI